ncbi:MAG: SMC family ATPase [Anaerolineales bacterium]|nr:SMC family ATPase [Anaerolineales bacterium]
MQLLSLDLDNIKSYERATVAFAPGVNSIVGRNGAGKSTLLEAIGFALFDSLAYKSTEFLREGARTGSVAVTFLSSYDERPYRVERRFGGSHAYFVYDVELQHKLCEGRADVLAFVRRHAGIDPAADLKFIFEDAIGVPQGSLTSAFLQSPSQRKPIFDRLLQVEEYKAAFDKLLEPRNLLKDRRMAIEQNVAILEARLERLPILTNATSERTVAIGVAQNGLRLVTSRLEEMDILFQTQDALRTETERLRAESVRLAERYRALEHQLAVAQRSHAEAEEAQHNVNQAMPGCLRHQAAQSRKLQLDEQLQERQRLFGEFAATDRTLAAVDAELKVQETALLAAAEAAQLVAQLAPEVEQQTALEEKYERTRLAMLRHAELEQQIRTLHGQQTRHRQRWQHLANQFSRVEGAQTRLQQVESEINALRANSDDRKARLATIQFEADRIKQQNSLLDTTNADARCPVCAQPLTATHRATVLRENETRIAALRTEYTAIKAQQKEHDAELQAHVLEQQQLQAELQGLPRAVDVEDADQLAQQAEDAVTSLETEYASLASTPDQLARISEALQTRNNPRQRSALAAQQAARYPTVAQAFENLTKRKNEIATKLTTQGTQLQAFAALDADLQVTTTELASTNADYQSVLSNQRLADRTGDLAAEVERLTKTLSASNRELSELDHKLESAQAEFDPVKYARLLSDGQLIRGEQASITARLSMLMSDQERDLTELASTQYEAP